MSSQERRTASGTHWAALTLSESVGVSLDTVTVTRALSHTGHRIIDSDTVTIIHHMAHMMSPLARSESEQRPAAT